MVAPPFTPTSSSFPSVPVEQLLSMQIEVTVNTPPLNVYVMVAEFEPTVSVKVVALARGAADTTNATATEAKIASLRLVIRTEFPPSGISGTSVTHYYWHERCHSRWETKKT